MRDDLAIAHDVGGIADVECLAHVVIGDQHPDAAVTQLAHDALDLAHRDGVHAGKRLIEQHEVRLGGQCASDLHAAALPAGKAHAGTVTNMRDAELVEQLLQACLAPVAIQILARLEDRHDVVGYRELAEDRGFLGQIADAGASPLMHGGAGQVVVIDGHATGIRAHEADDHVERGRLAGPVGAQQAYDVTLADFQRDVLDDLATLVGLGQMTSAEGTWAGSSHAHWSLLALAPRGVRVMWTRDPSEDEASVPLLALTWRLSRKYST